MEVGINQNLIVQRNDQTNEGDHWVVEGHTVGQFTGVHDCHNQEIYEGDIVKWGHIKGDLEATDRIAVVEFNPDLQWRRINGDKWVFKHGSFAYAERTHRAMEIIGNIHDNPELLEAK